MVSGFLSGIAGGATVAIVIKAIDQYSKEFNKATTGMDKFMKVAKIAGVAAATALTAFTVSAVKAGLQMIPIEQSFKKLSKASDKFLVDLNEATKGTISNFELMSNANKALLLGLDQEALPKLFENAAIVGRAAGRTTTEAISDITLGIGRQSRMILDNLGIIIKAGDVYDDYALLIGKVTSQLTAQERQTAFNAAAMEALQTSASNLGGVIPEDAITDIQRLTKSFSDFRTEFGKAFIENFQVALPKSEDSWVKFGQTTGEVLGLISASSIAAFKIFQIGVLGFSTAITAIIFGIAKSWEVFINGFIYGINKIIDGINVVRNVLGKKSLGGIDNVDLSSRLVASLESQSEKTKHLVEDVNTILTGVNKSFRELGQSQIDATEGTQKQIDAVKELSKEQELVNKLQGQKLIASSGDIFNPNAFISSAKGTRFGEFKSDIARNEANQGGGVFITIDNIIGLDAEEVSRAISNMLNNKVSL